MLTLTSQAQLDAYADVDAGALRANLCYFLKEVVPVAAEVTARLRHPALPAALQLLRQSGPTHARRRS